MNKFFEEMRKKAGGIESEWFHYKEFQNSTENQKRGWKIHISTFAKDLVPVLEKTIDYCLKNLLTFKFWKILIFLTKVLQIISTISNTENL
ncbi:hypothetical protein CG473_01380 [Mycoplasma testudineum]|nr:hypothetical protein CG473_01380 [Mycoplasma testudineum]